MQPLLEFAELLLAAGATQFRRGLAEPTHRRSPSSHRGEGEKALLLVGPALIVSGSAAIAKLLPHPNKASVPTPVNSVCKLQVLKTSEHLYFCSHFLERLTGIKEVYRAVIPCNHSLPHTGLLCVT